MITYVKGDIFSSPAKIIVNTVNTVGVMGKGIALEFKNKYPDMFQSYKEICHEGKLDIGTLYLWKKSEKWLDGEFELEGYEKFRNKLANYLKSNDGVVFDGKIIKELENSDAMICIGETNLEESQVREIWNLVRDAGIISPEEFPYEYQNISVAFLEMMREMRYAKNIFVSNDGMNFTKNPNAFQYVAN